MRVWQRRKATRETLGLKRVGVKREMREQGRRSITKRQESTEASATEKSERTKKKDNTRAEA